MKLIYVLFIIEIIFFPSAIHAQEKTAPALAIQVQLLKEPPDNKGTDVLNIYTIGVDFANETLVTNDRYTLQYSLDGNPLEKFSSQTLPFSFKRNFKGQLDGNHTIKIDVLDDKDNILTNGRVTVNVVRLKQ